MNRSNYVALIVVTALFVLMGMPLANAVLAKTGKEALLILPMLFFVLVLFNMSLGVIAGKGIIRYLSNGEILLVAIFVTFLSLFVNCGLIFMSEQVTIFFQEMGKKICDNKLSFFALFLIVQVILANVACFVAYSSNFSNDY